jgi:hypothetical protein
MCGVERLRRPKLQPTMNTKKKTPEAANDSGQTCAITSEEDSAGLVGRMEGWISAYDAALLGLAVHGLGGPVDAVERRAAPLVALVARGLNVKRARVVAVFVNLGGLATTALEHGRGLDLPPLDCQANQRHRRPAFCGMGGKTVVAEGRGSAQIALVADAARGACEEAHLFPPWRVATIPDQPPIHFGAKALAGNASQVLNIRAVLRGDATLDPLGDDVG